MRKLIFLIGISWVFFMACPIYVPPTGSDDDLKPPDYITAWKTAETIRVSWSPGKNASSYNVFYGLENNTAALHWCKTTSSTEYSVSSAETNNIIPKLTNGTTYYFAVRSRNYEGDQSKFSDIASIVWTD